MTRPSSQCAQPFTTALALALFACGAGCIDADASTRLSRAESAAAPSSGRTGGALPERPPVPSGELRLMTYNVHVNLAGDEATLDAIEAPGADVVLLQETSPEWEEAIRKRTAYPHVAFRHHDGAGGMAVLSKLPFRDVGELEPPEGGWFHAWVVVAETALGPVQLVNLHLRPQVSESGSVLAGVFTTAPVRRREIEAYFEAVKQDLPTVYAGDFNESSSGSAVRWLDGRGYRSQLPAGGPVDTWRWTTPLGIARAQLDHIVVDTAMLESTSVEVLDLGRSDHLPVIATLRLVAGR
jgi:endonuclease/exonuclease/phosphatase family metal-dependent hydrolase